MGQIFSVWSILKVCGPAGTPIRLRHGEALKQTWQFYHEGITGPRIAASTSSASGTLLRSKAMAKNSISQTVRARACLAMLANAS